MLSEIESLRVQSLWLLKKALTSREEPDISLNSKARFYTKALYARIINPKRGSALNTRRSDFIRTYIERVTSHKRFVELVAMPTCTMTSRTWAGVKL